MNSLPTYAKTLLLHGASIMGNFIEGYYYVEESMKSKDAIELQSFCEWIDKNIGGAANGNIDMLFLSFKNPNDIELSNKAKELADKIQKIKKFAY
jgi:hypothetical protein